MIDWIVFLFFAIAYFGLSELGLSQTGIVVVFALFFILMYISLYTAAFISGIF